MYAELIVTLKGQIKRQEATDALNEMIGGNSMVPQTALNGTPLMQVAGRALCAEQISNRAIIVYFMTGTDQLVANVFAQSLTQLKVQCDRISRQLPSHDLKIDKVIATILVTDNGTDTDILSGEKVSLWSRCWESLRDRFLGKFIPALVTVFFASLYMAGTPALKSAEIGLAAALAGALLDAVISAIAAETWKWKESK